MTVQPAAQIWRAYETDGVPASGFNKPDKREIKLWGQMLEQMLQVNRLGFATLALLNADLAHNANELAIVYADSTAANNGTYRKSGASGTGSWSRVGDLPGNLVVLTVTGGTGNAITATAIETPQQPGNKLYLLVPTASNTGATTIAVNGGAAVPITNAFNSALASGSLIAGNQALMSWQTDHYQLMIAAAVDGNAILADAVAARDAAIAAAAAAAIATAADRTALKALDTTLFKSCNLREAGREGTFAWKTGNFAALVTADAQEGIYVKANAIASSAGAWVRVRDDERVNVLWFGGSTAATAQAALDLAGMLGAATVVFPSAVYAMGSSSIAVPAGVAVKCSAGAILRRTADPASWQTAYGLYTGAMISLGSGATWSGGELNNTAVLGTSSTSNTISVGGTKTFTVAAGLPIAAGNFIRIWSASAPSAHFEGTVNSYSGTTLVLNADFAGGSGTKTDWQITAGAIFQSPLVMHNVSKCIVENVVVTGNWYVGLTLEAWNATTPNTLTTSFCTIKNCFLDRVQNRGIYLYGNCNENLIDGCFIDGGNGVTDYGVNFNASTTPSNNNQQSWNKVTNTTVRGPGFQGFSLGDACFYNQIEGCTTSSLTAAAGVGFLVQKANQGLPQYNRLINCTVNAAAGTAFFVTGSIHTQLIGCTAVVCNAGYVISNSGGSTSQYTHLVGCEALQNTTIGFQVSGSSTYTELQMIKAVGNTGNGVQIDSGSFNTQVSGRSIQNGAQFVDNGTSTGSTQLRVT